MNLVPLFEEALEFQDYNGTVLSDGKVAVYYIGRTRLADIYEDVAAEYPAENPRILNNLGMGPVYVNPAFDYEMVVFDAYGSELFSVKKYLASKGEHSTANVVVTPSESIAVSAWTVGDVQVYMPYLTGQLGKVYQGIDPIVVNNQVDKISANHVPLGVQDPLYFVQDDEEACIIGLSGGTVPEGTMNESAFGYEDGKITGYNGSGFSAGNSYEAGNYISIDNNTLSVTGLTPVPADTASTGLVASVSADITAMIPDTSDMATQTWVNEQGFLTAHQDISDKLDTTAFSTVSGDFLTAIPSEYVTENTLQSGLSSKLDSSSFSTVSSTFLTAVPAGYATEDWVTGQGYLTAHQSLDGLMSADLLEISDNKITAYNGTAFASQGGGVTGDYELSAGSGISIVDYPLEQKTVISVTAQGGNPEVEQAVIDNSATWNTVSDKLDTTAFSDVSGTFLTAHQDLSDYQTIAGMTAYQPVGDYLTTGDSANFYPSDNPSAFITGVDLTPYQTVEGMTAYQPVGDYLTADALDSVSGDWNEVSAKLDTTAFSDVSGTFLTAHQDISNKLDTTAFSDVSGSFLTTVPDTYLQNTDLSTEDGKVTAISGIPLSAGGDVPEGVMVESGLEYNAVNEISGYNGSAIAQYGAEKQWLVHDDTLVHAANSAQYALGVNLSAVAQLLGVDETVLWSGSANTGTLNFTDPLTSFKEFKFYVDVPERGINKVLTFYDAVNTVKPGFIQLITTTMTTGSVVNDWWQGVYNINATVDTATYKSMSIYANGQYYKQCSTTACGTNASKLVVKKVIGIGRKQ